MSFGAPYRPPCGGWPSSSDPIFGGPYQHFLSSENGFEVYTNNTLTHLKTPGATSGTQPPYERWNIVSTVSNSCEVGHCDPSTAVCGGWMGTTQDYPKVQYTMAASQPNTAPQSWTDAHTTVNFASCHKRGFKKVSARRLWQGIFGFVDQVDIGDNPPNLITGVCFDPGEMDLHSGFTGFTRADGAGYGGGSPPQTKYLQRTVTINASETLYPVLDGGGGSYGGLGPGTTTTFPTCTITDAINALSGEGTQTGSFVDFPEASGGTTTFSLTSLIGFMNNDFNSAIGYFAQLYFNSLNNPALFTLYQSGSEYGYYYTTPTYVGGGTSGTLIAGTGPTMPWVKVTLSISAGTFTATRISYQGGHTVSDWIPNVTETVSVSNTGMTYTWENYSTGDVGGHDVDDQFSIEVDLSNANTAASVYSDACSLLSYWNLASDTQCPWRIDALEQVSPQVSRLEYQGMMPFNLNSNEVDDMRLPINDSSGNAPFSSGWTPTYTQMGWFDPSVYEWQYPAGQSASTATASALIKNLDGSIQGAPKPAGYQNTFLWNFNDYAGCCFSDPATGAVSFDWYQRGSGKWLQDGFVTSPEVGYITETNGASIPLNSTAWPNLYEIINRAPGATIIYNDQQQAPSPNVPQGSPSCPYTGVVNNGGGLVLEKYAMILDAWPSQNFARPAGDDKFKYDETNVFCVTNLSGSGPGSTWTLTDQFGNTPASINTSLIWGGPSVDGFYAIASYSGGVVTLGALQFNVPSNWVSPSQDDGLCFGALRWPTKPGLLGRVGIVAISDGTHAPFTTGWTPTYQFQPAQPAFGMSQTTSPVGEEQVDVFDASMGSVATNITAKRLSDNTFTLPTAYSTAAFVMIAGVNSVCPWYMNDGNPKGDFVTFDWTIDYRIFTPETACDSSTFHQPGAGVRYTGFSQTQRCLPFTPKAPAVVCFTPNGESFTNGLTIAFPSSFMMDEALGSRWFGQVMVTMTDLFWQTPHSPCGQGSSPVSWQMDDGTCHANGPNGFGGYNAYYPFAPQVEARLTLPGNYGPLANQTPPALPGGITIGWLSPVTHTGADVIYPMGPIGYGLDGSPVPAVTPYIMWQRFCSASCSGQYAVYSTYAARCTKS